MVPSLPAASRPWSTTSSERRPSAHNRLCRSRNRSCKSATAASVAARSPGAPSVESGSKGVRPVAWPGATRQRSATRDPMLDGPGAGALGGGSVASPDEDGTVGGRDEVLGDGPEEHAGEFSVAASADDEQICP